MKEMVYRKERKVEILYRGQYKGYKFAILNLGMHPTAYIENKNGFTSYSEADDYAKVHGGFTYRGGAYWDENDPVPYLGWDYGHWCDWAGYLDDYANEGNKKWTTKEILDHVKEAIDSLEAVVEK